MSNLKESLEILADIAHEAIGYVGHANYAEREQEAHQKVDAKLQELSSTHFNTKKDLLEPTDNIIQKIKNRKAVIAKQRDEIRELYDEIGSLLEPLDTGIAGLDNALREISDAIDSISEVV